MKSAFTIFFLILIHLSFFAQSKQLDHYNKVLATQLDSILIRDQKYRLQLEEAHKKFAFDSEQVQFILKVIDNNDEVNLIKVKQILDQYGWLGPDVIGKNGSEALFLVIQHSDQSTQEKYLPMMRDAVKNGKAHGSALALLEDRVAIGQGKKQIYGSQVSGMNGKYKFSPIEDEINVNKRRAAVGLEPIEEYAKNFGIVYKQPSPNAIDNTSHIWEEHSIMISSIIVVLLFIVILFLLCKTKYYAWFWFITALILLNISTITLDFFSDYSMIKHYKGNFILFISSQMLIYCLVIFLINLSIYKCFKFKHILIEIASIFFAVIIYSFVLLKPCQNLLLADSDIMFFFNILEPIVYSITFLIIYGILFLISKRKKNLELNLDDSFTDK